MLERRQPSDPDRSQASTLWSRRRRSISLALGAVALLTFFVGGSFGASVVSTSLSGGSGTASFGGTFYAAQGALLTLNVTADGNTKCLRVTDGTTSVDQDSQNAQTTWTFSGNPTALFTAGAGSGVKTLTATAFKNSNNQHECRANQGEAFGSQTASYTLDNTGPTVTGSISPTPNAAGWYRSDVSIMWAATDAGSGLASGPTPASASQTADTTGQAFTSSATDRVGNTGTGSVTVKLDKTAPTIGHTVNPAPTAFGWNNTNVSVTFSCSDATSGVKACTGNGVDTAEGLMFFSGSANDNADNTAADSVSVQIDKTAPTLSGAPTTSPNANGWYNGNVTIAWTGADNVAGAGVDLSTVPTNTVITGEGTALTASAGPIRDRAGNSSLFATSLGVNIDRTPPNTTATAPPPTNWNNTSVTVALSANDGLSGVAATHYLLDGGPDTTGTSIPVSADGTHTIEFWSVDKAGNAEAHKTVTVKIDRTPPTINHSQAPLANGNGWNSTDVTVTFVCADAISGIKSCTTPQTIGTEGKKQPVTGTALDNADNATFDPATVSIDKTKPSVAAAPARLANAFGWYSAPVTIKFTCTDGLSGIVTCAADQTVAGEGAGQSGSGDGLDAADNSQTAAFGGINVDMTAPTLNGATTTSPNENGWYNGDVTVHWSAADALSGLDPTTVPGDSVVHGEGSALSAIASVSDVAGNSTSASVGGLHIDRFAPATTAVVRDPDFNGWYTGAVKVTLSAVDGLSGLEQTLYNVDGGAAQTYSTPFDFSQGGIHEIRFWSIDKAGNLESHGDAAHIVTLKLDDIKPSVAGIRLPDGNDFGWNDGPVTVMFNCSDDQTGIADCPTAVVLNNEGAGQSVARTATDRAGNTKDATVGGVNIDLTAPTLAGSVTTEPNANGWYNGDVTVHWTAADALSGVDPATVPADSIVAGEGDNLGTPVVSVLDKAGNKGQAWENGIHIDRTAPDTQASIPTDQEILKNGWYTGPVQVSLLGSDALSGIDASYYSVDGADPKAYEGSFQFVEGGIHTITFWSVDKAGNVEMRSAAGNSITLKIDNIAPTIKGTRRPGSEANGFGWNNGPVSVGFACADAETGINSCLGDSTLSDEGEAKSVTGTATDHAGNRASDTVGDINIDLTKPTLKGAATEPPNAAGWYRGDVTIHWTPDDNLSGINDATAPANSTISGEGTNLGAGPVAVKDKAGNESSPASVDNIDIDRTAPKITGSPTTHPNGNGWYTKSVTVTFDCTDNLSGVASCPTEKVLSDNGADQSVTSADAFDLADNKADGIRIGGINIDGQPPLTRARLDCDINNGYCRGKTATVVLTAYDQVGLSGVSAIHYSVDGGPDHVVVDNTATVDVPLDGSGRASIAFHAVDRADNVEGSNSAEVKWDNIAPAVTHTLKPNANASGWNNENMLVHFLATDDYSGIASISPDVPVSDETAGRDIVGTADDVAGNTGVDTAHVKLDKTPPTVAGAPLTDANIFDWYRGDVTVHFTCADGLSAIAVCPDNVTLTEQGAGQSVTRAARDTADNTATATVGGINIDRTQPKLSGKATTDPNDNGWYRNNVVIGWTASDDLSGIDPATTPADDTITGEGDNLGAGASVSDRAGNSIHATLDGIRIDRRDPNTTIGVPAPLESGWYADTIPVTLTAADALSGIEATYYSVDGGDARLYDGIFDYGVRGVHSLSFWSVDRAGNVEAKATKVLKIDNLPPTISAAKTPAPTKYGWNNGDVTAHFTCSDAESGLAGCENDHVFHNEGPNQSFTGTAIDNANNKASTLVDGVNIDLTKPSLVGRATVDANAAGWYKGDVTIEWVAGDSLSGIDPDTTPAQSMIVGEGASLGAGPVSVSDKAGNSQSALVGGIKIDRTAPTISPSKPAPNAAGWYNGSVVVSYGCADALSGVARCPDKQVLEGDGAGQSVTSDSAADVAGNVAAGRTTGGINIDSKAPQSTADQSCGAGNNWCQQTATVHITATDQAGLSGVREIRYSISGGAEQAVPGASATVNIALSSTGTASVSYYAVDNAGNVEPKNGVSIKYDNIAPTVTHTLDPIANAAYWNNANTTVRFNAVDDLGGSGVDPLTVTPDQVLAVETAGKTIDGQAFDYAKNLGTDSVTVKLDKTPPTIGGAATTQPNTNGWYSGPVTVHFTCEDTLSGMATCTADSILSSNGDSQMVKGTAIDKAGNTTDTIVTGINIDTTKPMISFTGVSDGGIYTLGSVPQAGCTSTDTFSGVAAPCKASVTGGTSNGVGTYTVAATVTDKAGNSTTSSVRYRVIYRWDGFLQPINDTAHQVGTSTSIFKGGSTVPTKFELKNAAGQLVQSNVLPKWLVPAKGSSTGAPVDELVYSEPATSGTTFAWDGSQYHYNWSTKGFATGFYYRIGVQLDDLQIYDVNIGLR